MADIFSKIIAQGIRDRATFPARTQKAREWYRNAAKGIKNVNNRTFMSQNKTNLVNKAEVGKMYLFNYDPKHKATLPYYDKYPLVFPIGPAKGGFYGLNMHYLPPQMRASLMDNLYDYVSDDNMDSKTKINMTYKVLNSTTKLKAFKPCIKHYLFKHVRSRYLFIYPSEWDMALMLPLARFEKQSSRYVYSKSLSMI
tara:strand:- start:983 stop:1573 length:591 start_codon:yes stop_codon:yes gene_type:complete